MGTCHNCFIPKNTYKQQNLARDFCFSFCSSRYDEELAHGRLKKEEVEEHL